MNLKLLVVVACISSAFGGPTVSLEIDNNTPYHLVKRGFCPHQVCKRETDTHLRFYLKVRNENDYLIPFS